MGKKIVPSGEGYVSIQIFDLVYANLHPRRARSNR